MTLGDLLGGGAGGKVRVVFLEARYACPDVVGKLQDVGVVDQDGVVVTLAGNAHAVLSAGELILQAHELIAGTELRVVFSEGEQATEGVVERGVGGDFGCWALGIEQAGASVGNVTKDGAFFLGEALYGFDEVGDEVGAPLHLVFNLRPACFDVLVERDHLVACTDITRAHHERGQHQDTENSEDYPKCTTHRMPFLLWPPLGKPVKKRSQKLPVAAGATAAEAAAAETSETATATTATASEATTAPA